MDLRNDKGVAGHFGEWSKWTLEICRFRLTVFVLVDDLLVLLLILVLGWVSGFVWIAIFFKFVSFFFAYLVFVQWMHLETKKKERKLNGIVCVMNDPWLKKKKTNNKGKRKPRGKFGFLPFVSVINRKQTNKQTIENGWKWIDRCNTDDKKDRWHNFRWSNPLLKDQTLFI